MKETDVGLTSTWASRLVLKRSSSTASWQRFSTWKQSSTIVAFGKTVDTISFMLEDKSSVTSLTASLSFSGICIRMPMTSSAWEFSLCYYEKRQTSLPAAL